jgi:hypothetical protein
MKNSKLFELLSTFSESEYKELQKFSLSNYFNQGRKYPLLLKTLKKSHPSFSNKELNKKFVYSKIFPGKAYNNQIMKNLITGTMRLCETYLVYKQTFADKRDYYNVLADQMQRRRLFKQSEKNLKKSNKFINTGGIDRSYYKKLYEHYQIKRNLDIANNNQKESIKSLSMASTNFFYYIILEISTQLEEMIVLNHNWNANFESHLTYEVLKNLIIENILKFLKDNSYHNHEIIELYSCHLKQMINYKDENLFAELKTQFKRNYHLLSRWGKYNLFLSLANACIKLQEVNEVKYTHELFELYKEQLNQKLYKTDEDSTLEQDMFRNILINALKLREFDWAESFLNQYLNELLPEYRENMENYAYSNLSFEKSKFEKALEFISLVKYDTFAFKLDVRTLMLKIYYELGYYEQARFLIDSFKHFILENVTISEYIKSVHLNFIKFVNDLIKVKESKKIYEVEKIKKEISFSQVRNKEWLMEKIKEVI